MLLLGEKAQLKMESIRWSPTGVALEPVKSRCGRNGPTREAARVGQKLHCTINRASM